VFIAKAQSHMPRFVMLDSIRHPLPHEPWIADQFRNDDTSFMVHMQFRFPKKGARDDESGGAVH
jgi:hypothetical protein